MYTTSISIGWTEYTQRDCERRYRAYDPKDPWIMVDNDNKLHSYASKKPNQLNNFGPCWVVICWLVDHPEVAEQFGIKMGFV